MSPAVLFADLKSRGLTLSVSPACATTLLVSPGNALIDADRAAIREHKDALLSLLADEADSPGPLYEPGVDFHFFVGDWWRKPKPAWKEDRDV